MKKRKGFLVWLILFIAIVLSIVLYSFLFRATGAHRLTANIYHGHLASQLAAGAIELATVSFKEWADKPNGPYYQLLIKSTNPADMNGSFSLSLIPGFDERLERLQTSLFKGRNVDITMYASIVSASALTTDNEMGFEPREKRGSLLITAEVSVLNASKRRSALIPFKVVNLVVPVVSKFTLFLPNPEPNEPSPLVPRDSGYGGYNLYENKIDGTATEDRPNNIPLIFYNHSLGTSLGVNDYDYRKLGWIYMGETSGRNVVLHLTSGTDNTYGEYFHYKSLEYNNQLQAARRLEYVVNESGELPDLFKTVFSYDSDNGKHNNSIDFRIKRRRLGFFKEDMNNPPGDMDAGLLKINKNTFTVKSSCLHLFGTNKDASPTLVIGPVYRAYPEYAGIIVDTDSDGNQDGTVMPLLAYEDDTPTGILQESFKAGESTKETYEFSRLKGGQSYSTAAERAFANENIFNDSFSYENLQSKIVYEPYNRSVDAMTAEGLKIPPPPHRDWDSSFYPKEASEVTIPRMEEGAKPYFKGSLSSVSNSAIELRLTYRFDSLDDFRQWTTVDSEDKSLKLGYNVRIDKEIDLRTTERVIGGGMLAGNAIKLGPLAREGDVPFSAVALNGDITANFGGKIQAALVALNGSLESYGGSSTVDVLGNLAVSRLSPSAIQSGGEVRFDADLDPVLGKDNGYEKGFRLFVSDAAEMWDVR